MPKSELQDPRFLEMSAQFLTRLKSDPAYARKYEEDQAGALQELFPDIAKVPKVKVQEAIEDYVKVLAEASTTPTGHKMIEKAAIVAVAAAAARAATAVASTSVVRAAATSAVSGVAGALAARAVTHGAEPPAAE